jgi:dUTP pyrophosphatase
VSKSNRAESKLILARNKGLINTELSIAVPEGTYGRIAPRSGLASKFMIDTGAGVIDADYRGKVHVLLFNLSEVDFQGKPLLSMLWLYCGTLIKFEFEFKT